MSSTEARREVDDDVDGLDDDPGIPADETKDGKEGADGADADGADDAAATDALVDADAAALDALVDPATAPTDGADSADVATNSGADASSDGDAGAVTEDAAATVAEDDAIGGGQPEPEGSHTPFAMAAAKKDRFGAMFSGANLVKADGTEIDVESLRGADSFIGVYFSAHWCPPCRQFTPMLAKWYTQFKAKGASAYDVCSPRAYVIARADTAGQPRQLPPAAPPPWTGLSPALVTCSGV